MTPIHEAVETYLYAASALSEHTARLYKERLGIFCAYCEGREISLEQITPKVFREFLGNVAERISPQSHEKVKDVTVAAYAREVKVFLNWCSTYEDYFGCVKQGQLKAMRIPRVEKRIQPIFTQEEVQKMYDATKEAHNQFMRDRDRALVSLLIDSGVRANELCTLKVGDVHLDLDDPYIKIMGKGHKEREVGVGKGARMDLHRFLRNHRKGAGGDEVVFLAYKRVPLNRYSLDQIIYRLKSLAGVEKPGGAHMFRRTYATAFMDAGGDIYDLKSLMGHENLSTTERYIQNADKRKARRRSSSVWDKMK